MVVVLYIALRRGWFGGGPARARAADELLLFSFVLLIVIDCCVEITPRGSEPLSRDSDATCFMMIVHDSSCLLSVVRGKLASSRCERDQ